MQTNKTEEKVYKVVSNFVKSRNGFYSKHCSDQFLIELILFQLFSPSEKDRNKLNIQLIFEGDQNVAYDCVCWIFESILEDKCHAGGNGHHVAQKFAVAMEGINV